MKLLFKHLLLSVWILVPTYVWGQIPGIVIEINGKVISYPEKKGVPGVEIRAKDNKVYTDESGEFNFKIGYSDEAVKLEIRPEGYEILHPDNGILLLVEDTYSFNIDIIICSDSKLLKQLDAKVKEFELSQKDLKLTKRQNNRLRRELLEKTAFFENKINENHKEINDLKAESERDLETIKKLEENIAQLEMENKILREELFKTAAENFRLKQKYFNEITADLNDYLVRVKDVHDLLPRIKQYFPLNYDKERFEAYEEIVDAYNSAFAKINKNHKNFVEEVKHDWEPAIIGERLEETFDILFAELHPEIKSTFGELSDALSDGYNRKKAIKSGRKAAPQIEFQISDLETSMNQTLSLLEEAL